MKRMRWYEHITINLGWVGLGITSGSMTPLILPFMIQEFVPAGLKNTYYGQLRFYGLMIALFAQPLAGMLSDRCRSVWGRRRPFILAGGILSSLTLILVGFANSYWFLFAVSLMQQAFSNTAHGAIQGLIPDLVPEADRVHASGIKAIMELLPLILISFTVARLLDQGNLAASLLFIIGVVLITMLTTVFTVREKPFAEVSDSIWPQVARIALLTLAFTVVVRGSLAGTLWMSHLVQGPLALTLPTVGLAGVVAIIGSIIVGVWFSIRMGLGAEMGKHTGFTWWVINRLLFMAAIGAIQGFAFFYLQDVLEVPNAAGVTARLMMVVGLLTLVAAIASAQLAKRWGKLQMLRAAGIVAALGIVLLLFAVDLPLVYASGALIGLASGVFMATNWAVGTYLVPVEEAGRFLGISNLAGAGAGAVSNGIGGPLADYFNAQQHGLGYLVVFAIFGLCFLLSALVLVRVRRGLQENSAWQEAEPQVRRSKAPMLTGTEPAE